MHSNGPNRSVKVSDIMVAPVITARPDATLESIAALMLEHHIGCVPIVGDGGKLVGIVTESDFMGAERPVPFSMYKAPQVFGQWFGREEMERVLQSVREFKAGDVMSRPVRTVPEDAGMQTAVEQMMRHSVKRLVVVRDGVPIGIVARHDLLRVMLSQPARSI